MARPAGDGGTGLVGPAGLPEPHGEGLRPSGDGLAQGASPGNLLLTRPGAGRGKSMATIPLLTRPRRSGRGGIDQLSLISASDPASSPYSDGPPRLSQGRRGPTIFFGAAPAVLLCQRRRDAEENRDPHRRSAARCFASRP
ncbi:hypothetical protein SPHINGOT1_510002 [Sphingomonas sp. T1]|nr:hypothetical protein SPHINGOT1_510002 [Sphingomonas sp. T1]